NFANIRARLIVYRVEAAEFEAACASHPTTRAFECTSRSTMAASDLIVAAIAAFFVSQQPTGQTVRTAVPCAPALRLRASETREAPLAPMRALACAAPRSALTVAFNAAREWIGGAWMPDVAAQPRPDVAVATLSDPADADPILKAARLVIGEW